MGKRRKRRTRVRRNPPLTARDRHHLTFPKHQDWGKGYAKLICQSFVRPVPVVWHRELHSKLTHVPLPNEELLRQAWVEYQREKDIIDSMGVCQAIAWLYVHIPDVEFRKAMQFQLDFFATKFEETV